MCDICKNPTCKGLKDSAKKVIVTAMAGEIVKVLQIAGMPIHPATIAAMRLAARMMEMKEFRIDPAKMTEAQNKACHEVMERELEFILHQGTFDIDSKVLDNVEASLRSDDVNKESEVEQLNKLMALDEKDIKH